LWHAIIHGAVEPDASREEVRARLARLDAVERRAKPPKVALNINMATEETTTSISAQGKDPAATLGILGKPVLMSNSRILNLDSGSQHKHLCDGPTFSAGTACAFSCEYCYVEAIVGAKPFVASLLGGHKFEDVVIRRANALENLRKELRTAAGRLKYKVGEYEVARASGRPIVCYGSPLVDIAASNELATETAQMVHVLLDDTDWDVRLLSKSPLIKLIAQSLTAEQKSRVIFGLSTGSLDDELARAIEPTCPSPSRRFEALRWLQGEGYRTFAMLCPILPQPLEAFIEKATEAIRPEKCEHVWAEVLNVRGESMSRTLTALQRNSLHKAADDLRAISGEGKKAAWEQYARKTFLALAQAIPKQNAGPRLRFLQYVTRQTEGWWRERVNEGAVPLGRSANQEANPAPRAAESNTAPAQSVPLPEVTSTSPSLHLLEGVITAAKAAADAARLAAEAADKSANLLVQFAATLNPAAPSMPPSPARHLGKIPDPKRSEAAKRAWITIRRKKASQTPPAPHAKAPE
jgi:DNA repair photolyase